MKSTLKVKLLQHLAGKKNEGGFTLIELLVVIIIIGILAAIALPSFLNQANKARQSEAKTYIGSANKGQQAYFTEKSFFSGTISGLGVGLKTTTKYYSYGGVSALDLSTDPPSGGDPDNTILLDEAGGEVAAAAGAQGVVAYAAPLNASLKGYTGVAYLLKDDGGNTTSTAVLCENPVADGGALDIGDIDVENLGGLEDGGTVVSYIIPDSDPEEDACE